MDYSGGNGGDVQQPMHHLPNHAHQYATPQSATAPSFQYQQHIESSRMQMAHDGSSLHPNHVHHPQQAYYADASAAAARQSLATPSTPSQNTPPRFSQQLPSPAGHSQSQPQQPRQPFPSHSGTAGYTPTDRSLPSLDVSDPSFDDAYVQFVLYCNPSFPLTVDTTELRRVFRSPPKSDGKSFSVFTLFELLKKLDNKELKTWTELALELGVERPSVEKGQSSQKVQQYSVRLKRWMRALHIDAFFEYLMGKKHTYFLVIPALSEPFPESRDGVPIEEDLAVRAIDPKFRPKRGRRRADEQDEDGMEPMSAIEPKRPHLDTSVSFHGHGHGSRNEDYPMSAYPQSAVPMSAHPDFANAADPWSSLGTPASAMAPRSAMSNASQQLRWRNETPSTPHPLSAVTPMSAHPESSISSAWDTSTEPPSSAITPSSARSGGGGRRRRHGPAVSSAWPSTNTTANGKLRGRPPSNRSVRDGPFVTFPANPRTKEGPVIDLASARVNNRGKEAEEKSAETTPTPTPSVVSRGATTESPKPQAHPHEHQFLTPQLPTPVSASASSSVSTRLMLGHPGAVAGSRPERLQLQVPQHVGGPVHLVTPTLLVNGQHNALHHHPHPHPTPTSATTTQTPQLSTASTARTTGSSFFGAPAPTESSVLTATTDFDHEGVVFLTPKTSPRPGGAGAVGTEDLKRTLVGNLLRAEIVGRRKRLRGTEAKELADAILRRLNSDAGGQGQGQAVEMHRALCASWLGISPLSSTGPTSAGKRVITVRRFRVGGDGYDSPIDDDDEGDEDLLEEGGDSVRQVWDVEWTQSLGGIEGSFSVKGITLATGSEDVEMGEEDEVEGWHARYLRAEERRRAQEVELEGLRARVLDALV